MRLVSSASEQAGPGGFVALGEKDMPSENSSLSAGAQSSDDGMLSEDVEGRCVMRKLRLAA